MNSIFFFFNDTATTEIYTLSLHDALPIYQMLQDRANGANPDFKSFMDRFGSLFPPGIERSEEHTSELQSLTNLVCRLLLEKKKNGHRAGQGHGKGRGRAADQTIQPLLPRP